jgi:hypothetical protein
VTPSRPGEPQRGCQAPALRGDPDYMSQGPDFRLTIRGDRVLAVDWHPWLVSGGPMTTMLRARGRAGVAIADVTVIREHEVATEAVVRLLAGDRPESRAALTGWSRSVGYRRLWLPDEVVELPGPGEGEAENRCRGCGARLSDGGPGFWHRVRTVGRFPASCPLCGADLPQWRVCQRSPDGADPSCVPEITRRTRCA